MFIIKMHPTPLPPACLLKFHKLLVCRSSYILDLTSILLFSSV